MAHLDHQFTAAIGNAAILKWLSGYFIELPSRQPRAVQLTHRNQFVTLRQPPLEQCFEGRQQLLSFQLSV
jgi:hypothetical protein